MASFVYLICAQCGAEFRKDIGSYKAALKKGKDKFFCNMQHLGLYKRGKSFSHSEEAQMYSWDENVIESDMEARYYLLGYICSDGCIVFDKRYQRYKNIILNSTDFDALDSIRKRFKMSYPVKLARAAKGNRKDLFALLFSSAQTKKILDYGLNPSVKQDRPYPETIPDEYFFHFLRGYMDGDGCIRFYRQKGREHLQLCSAAFVCHISFNDLFMEQFCRVSGLPNHSKDKEYNKEKMQLKNISYTGTMARTLLNFVYKDATIYMQRKYEIYKQIKEYYGDIS